MSSCRYSQSSIPTNLLNQDSEQRPGRTRPWPTEMIDAFEATRSPTQAQLMSYFLGRTSTTRGETLRL